MIRDGSKPFIRVLLIALVAVLIGFAVVGILKTQRGNGDITSFEECAAAGHPVMESYPERCMANGKIFTRKIEE